MKDCVGKEISLGDKVICSDMQYADLLIGEVIGFTPKKARIRYVRSEHLDMGKQEQLKESYQIFVYEKASLEVKDEKNFTFVNKVALFKIRQNLEKELSRLKSRLESFRKGEEGFYVHSPLDLICVQNYISGIENELKDLDDIFYPEKIEGGEDK